MNNEDVKELDAIFKDMGGVSTVEDIANGYENLADGTYLGEIASVEACNSQKTGKPMIKMMVAVEGGKKECVCLMLAGKDLNATKIAIARTVSQLKKLGVEGVELSDFVAGAERLTGTRVNLTIETNGSFVNRSLTLA